MFRIVVLLEDLLSREEDMHNMHIKRKPFQTAGTKRNTSG